MTAWQALREAPRRIGRAAGAARPDLKLIRTPARRLAAVPFGVLMVLLLAAGTVGLLLLNTTLQNQAFEMRAAQREAAELGYLVSDLESQVYAAESPAELARKATALGMVPNPYGVFVDLRSGQVVGNATPVSGNELRGLLVQQPAPETTEGLDAAPVDESAQGQATDQATPSPSPDAATPGQSTAAGAAGAETGGNGAAQGGAATTQEATP